MNLRIITLFFALKNRISIEKVREDSVEVKPIEVTNERDRVSKRFKKIVKNHKEL